MRDIGRWLLLLSLVGCPRPPEVVLPQQPPPQVVVTPAPAPLPTVPALNGVLGSVGWTIALPRERQAEEIERWELAVARDDLPTDRLRLALLLALGDEDVRDPERVRELLRGRWYDGDDLAAETLARTVLELVESRQAEATTRLRLLMELEAEREVRADLEAKLDAVRAIESEMGARDRPIDALDAEAEAEQEGE